MAEAKALAGVLAFCVFFDVQAISIFGNSRQVIDHVNGVCHIRSPLMIGWMDKIMFLWGLTRECSIQLIGHEQNLQADCVFKDGLLSDSGSWSMEVKEEEKSSLVQDFVIPGY